MEQIAEDFTSECQSKVCGSSIRTSTSKDLARSVSSFVGGSIVSRRVCTDFTALMVPTHEMCERNRVECNRGPSRAIKVRKLALDRSLTNRHAALRCTAPRHAMPRQSSSTTYLAIVTNVSPPNRFAFTGRRASLTVCLNSADVLYVARGERVRDAEYVLSLQTRSKNALLIVKSSILRQK